MLLINNLIFGPNSCSFIPSNKKLFGPVGKGTQFQMKHNISLKSLLLRLKKTQYKIIKQVISLHTKVIGVLVQDRDKNTMYDPCAPSPIEISLPTILINETTTWWNTYKESVRLLQNIANIGDVGK